MKSPEQQRAHNAVRDALRRGELVRQSCEMGKPGCADKPTVAHHDDYSKPLEVRWLCRMHHSAVHQKDRA